MKKWVSLLLAAMMLLGVFSAAMAEDKIVLKAACWDLEKTPYYNAIKAGFEAAYPNVTLEWVDLASQDYNIKATTMLSGGEAIDLMAVKELSDMQNWAREGFILNLNDRIAAASYDMSKYAGMDECYKSIADGAYTTYKH